MDMVNVIDCSAVNCVYNVNKQCHTMAITVGSDHARCESFMEQTQKEGVMDLTGRVGACHVGNCQFNESLECHASGIHVNPHSGHADCMTFNPKK
ncbi:MAG: DUF1540 domain-containing protein [Endomicrobiales bacterium]